MTQSGPKVNMTPFFSVQCVRIQRHLARFSGGPWYLRFQKGTKINKIFQNMFRYSYRSGEELVV